MPPAAALMLAGSLDAWNHPLTKAMIIPTTQELEAETLAPTIREISKPLIMAGYV